MNRVRTAQVLFFAIMLCTSLLADIKLVKRENVKVSLGIDAAFNGQIDYKEVAAGFEVDAAKVSLSARYKDQFKLFLSMDPSKPNSSSKSGHTEILDKLYLQWDAREKLRIRVGQFKVPFGYENAQGLQERVLITHRKSSKEICPGLDRGVMLYGKEINDKFSYYTGLFNGTSVEQSLNSITLLAPVKLQFRKEFLRTSLTWGVNSYLRAHYPYNTNLKYRWANGLFTNVLIKRSTHSHLSFTGEFLEKLDFRDLKTSEKAWEIGGFLISSYRNKNWEPILFAEIYDKNVNLEDEGDKRIFGGGLNYHFFEEKLRLSVQVEYESLPHSSNDNISGIVSLRGFL